MARIASIGICIPPYRLNQETTVQFAREMFKDSFDDIDRLLKIFENGQIKERYFSVPLEWFSQEHTFAEKNDYFIEQAVLFGIKAIKSCLENPPILQDSIHCNEIDAIFYITSSGLSTPSIEAKIMNHLPFQKHCKRIPIWGLGCAGGAAGLSRAFEYCKAFPKAKVLVLSVELCSLTFQKNDQSKSNLIGTSLFADGIACALVCGSDSEALKKTPKVLMPKIVATQSTLIPNSENVMGWDIRNEGFFVVFSKDIPSLIRTTFKHDVETFLEDQQLSIKDLHDFAFHPGGKKVLQAYIETLGLCEDKLKISQEVLQHYGNMSSATIFYVLKKFIENPDASAGDFGLAVAVGPGFSSEKLLYRWE